MGILEFMTESPVLSFLLIYIIFLLINNMIDKSGEG